MLPSYPAPFHEIFLKKKEKCSAMIMAKESLERWEQSAKHRPKLKDDRA